MGCLNKESPIRISKGYYGLFRNLFYYNFRSSVKIKRELHQSRLLEIHGSALRKEKRDERRRKTQDSPRSSDLVLDLQRI